MATITYLSIAETREKFASKEISPLELVKAHVDRAQSLHPKLNAFVHFDTEAAVARAGQAEAAVRNGALASKPLLGIPLTVKSCIDVAGWPCPSGSLLRKGHTPGVSATLVERLVDAGAILLGNTNTPEYLMAYETDNLVTGKTCNPWNLAYSAGGSSGGEAAAIAGGCSMGGVGSDGGGSIRTPAHFTGICGLKPTPGRIPATGHFPPPGGAFSWLGVVGPMARTVADLQILFDVMAGPCDGDPLSVPVPRVHNLRENIAGLRIGILESSAFCAATRETQQAVQQAANLLAAQGFRIEPFRINNLDAALRLWWFFFGPVIAGLLRESAAGQESQLSPMLRDYILVASADPEVTLDRFRASCNERDAVRSDILRQLRDVPLLLSPVSTAPAFPHGSGSYRAGDPCNYRDTMRHCQWLNLAGFPGLSLPMGRSPSGLPINVQLIARPYQESLLFEVARRLESARGPWQRPPIE